MVIEEGCLNGPCEGFQDFEYFKFSLTGSLWQQVEHFYQYSYSYMPMAKITEKEGLFFLSLPGMTKEVEVKKC